MRPSLEVETCVAVLVGKVIANIEASVSSSTKSMHQQVQVDMNRKLQEEREQMTADLKRNMEEDLQRQLEEEHEHMKGEVDKMFQEQMAAVMTRIQQGQVY